MDRLQTLHYQRERDERLEELPIGQLGFYYTVLGTVVLLAYFSIRRLAEGTQILVPLGVLFWGAGLVVSIAGAFRFSGRRWALTGMVLCAVGAVIYVTWFA